ncbi:MAG: hypothetical protein HC913_09385, partial [Microscillaceae bacterium]|nr:hypothetical protein [Microscillaceae bacterium]
MKNFFLFFLFFGLAFSSQGQTLAQGPSSTRYIRDIYEYVQEKIHKQQYYINEFKVNANNLPWANQETFHRSQQYHYSFVGDDTPILRMVTVITKMAEKNYYTEYLFDNDGQLIFCFDKQNDVGQYNFRELHAYFEQGLCVNLMIDRNIIDAK